MGRQLGHAEIRAVGPHMVQFADGSTASTPTLDVRFLAWLIDIVVILALACGIQLIFWANPPDSLAGFRDLALLDRLVSFVLFFVAVCILYDALLHSLWGKTLGKLSANTGLVSVESGARVTWWQAIGRAMLRVPLGVTVLDDPAHRGLHDYLARTVVIYRDRSEEM